MPGSLQYVHKYNLEKFKLLNYSESNHKSEILPHAQLINLLDAQQSKDNLVFKRRKLSTIHTKGAKEVKIELFP